MKLYLITQLNRNAIAIVAAESEAAAERHLVAHPVFPFRIDDRFDFASVGLTTGSPGVRFVSHGVIV